MSGVRVVRFSLMILLAMGLSGMAAAATTTPAERDGRHDFDFLIGKWNIANRQRPAGTTVWKEFAATTVDRSFLDGVGNMDEMTLPKGNSGISLRFFDPVTKEWSIYWATSRVGKLDLPPVVGHFKDGVGLFYCDDTDAENKPVKVRYTWSKITPQSAHWDQSTSSDGGKSWTVNWSMEFTRTAK